MHSKMLTCGEICSASNAKGMSSESGKPASVSRGKKSSWSSMLAGCAASCRLWALLAESLSLSIVFWSSSEESNLMAELGVKVADLNWPFATLTRNHFRRSQNCGLNGTKFCFHRSHQNSNPQNAAKTLLLVLNLRCSVVFQPS